MKVIFHCGYDGVPVESIYDDCFLDNRQEPVVRIGGELFKSCYDIEWGCSRLHIIDPSRSLAAPILEILDWDNGEPNWMTYDCLSRLIADMGINRRHPSREDAVAFWTFFPDGVSSVLSNSYMHDCSFNAKHADIARVLNNPFFYKDRNATERRLVAIAEDSGLRFALDRIFVIPSPEVLAREIALLNYGIRNPKKVESAQSNLVISIAETMEDWGLNPTVGLEEAEQ